jgi:hypothetical protein
MSTFGSPANPSVYKLSERLDDGFEPWTELNQPVGIGDET